MNEIILGVIACVGFMGIGAFIFWLFSQKSKTIKDYAVPPGTRPKPDTMPSVFPARTIDSKYGQNLLDLAERIYLSGGYWNFKAYPEARARISARKAHELLVEIENHCNEIDEAKKKTSLEEAEKAFREMSKL